MKILLINPEDKHLEQAGDRIQLGILYLGAVLCQTHTVKILDLNHQPQLEKTINNFNPDFIGLGFTTPLFPDVIRLVKRIKMVSEAKLICGGPHPSADPESCLKYFDYIVAGEGEKAFPYIIENKPATGQIFNFPFIEDLDTIPKPARHLVDMNKYNMMIEGKRTATLISSRGCSGSCVYCSRKSLGNKVRMHSAKYIVEEMEDIMKYGYNSFYFQDDCFTYDKERIKKLWYLILSKGWDIQLRVTTRADLVDKEILLLLKDIGLKVLSIGIEHADNEVLRKSGKGIKVEQCEKVIKWCKELNIKVKGFFILNLPGATESTINKTMEWIKMMDIDSYDFYTLVALPGSALWDNYEQFGMRLLDKNYGYYQTDGGVNIDSEDLPKSKLLEILEKIK